MGLYLTMNMRMVPYIKVFLITLKILLRVLILVSTIDLSSEIQRFSAYVFFFLGMSFREYTSIRVYMIYVTCLDH